MDYNEIMDLSQEAKENLLRMIEDSDESPADRESLKKLFGMMSPLELTQVAFPAFQKEMFKETDKYGKMDFVPVYTQNSKISELQYGESGMETINSSTVHYVQQLHPSLYLNIYFMRAARDSFYACCYCDDIFNHIYGKDVRNTKGGETFPKTMAKRFPYICKILRNTTMHGKISDPYLNTIAFGGNTSRQWYLCIRVNDIGEFADLTLFGPKSKLMRKVVDDINHAAALIMNEIYKSADTVMKRKFSELTNVKFGDED